MRQKAVPLREGVKLPNLKGGPRNERNTRKGPRRGGKTSRPRREKFCFDDPRGIGRGDSIRIELRRVQKKGSSWTEG